MKLIKYFWPTLVGVLLLAGCSSQPDYLQSSSLPPIVVPEEVDDERLGQLYPVPEWKGVNPDEFQVPFPPIISMQQDTATASLYTMGDQAWILNPRPPAATWSQLAEFFQQQQIPVARQDLGSATIVSDWFEMAAPPGFAVRYSLRLEQGFQPGTTEIHLANQLITKSQLPPGPADEPETLQNIAHSNWLANRLLGVLNNPGSSISNSLLATTIVLPAKAELIDVEGEPVLVMRTSIQRLDRALTTALDDEGLITYATTTGSGPVTNRIYHLNQYEVRGEKSRWYNPFSWGNNQPVDRTSRYSLEQILTHLPNEPEVNGLFAGGGTGPGSRENKPRLRGVKGYLLVRKPATGGGAHRIYVRDGYGGRLDRGEARELLDAIRLRLL